MFYNFREPFKIWHSFLSNNIKPIMQEDRITPSTEGTEEEKNDIENPGEDRFESDTQKLMRKHLEDPDHVITDDDIAGVRVGMVPPEFDAATEVRFEDEKAIAAKEEEILREAEKEDENLDDQRITPWDTIDPTR